MFKTGTNLSNQSTSDSRNSSTGTAAPGDTIKWVLNYSNETGATASVSISDLITQGQGYVPGSLQVPPALTPRYTINNGGSWANGTPPAGANGVGVQGSVAGSNSGAAAMSPFQVTALSFNTPGGDGYSVEGYGNNIYTVYHHNPSSTVVFCATINNQVCPGWPARSTYVNATPGTKIGTGGTSPYTTAGVNGSFIANGKLYWPVHANFWLPGVNPLAASVGLQCLNLDTLLSCGFIELDRLPFGALNGSYGMIAGDGVQAGNGKYYYVAASGNLLCFDPAAGTDGASCGAFNDLGNNQKVPAVAGPGYFAEVGTYGKYVYFTHSRNGQTYLYGYDVSGASPVAVTAQNTGPTQDATATSYAASEVFPVVSQTGVVLGACAVYNSACFDTSNNPIANPWTQRQYSYRPNVANPAAGFAFGTGVLIGTKYYTTVGSTSTNCYDFANWSGTGAVPACSGFNGPGTRDSYSVRPLANLPGCMAINGDGAQIKVFNQVTGGACVSGSASVPPTAPSAYYCDGTSHTSQWDKLTLLGLTGSEYGQAVATVYDMNGAAVPGFSNVVMNGTTLDISSLPVSGNYASLSAAITLTGVTDQAAVNKASATLSWAGGPMQMCYRTTVPPLACGSSTPMSNVAQAVTTAGNVTDGPAGTSSGTALFTAAPTAAQCRLNFTKTASAPILQPGGALSYTITVTNLGTMPYSDAAPASFSDDLSQVLAGATYLTATATSGSASYATPILSWSGPLAAGGTATVQYLVTGGANPPATLANTVVSPQPSNCPSNAPAAECTAVVTPVPQVSIAKSTPATTLTSGGQIVYTIVASNTGTVSATGTVVSDPLPAGIASQTWTCSSAGASCPNPSGSGSLNETLTSFPAGSTVTYTVTATVSADPPAHVTNTATVVPPAGGICAPSQTQPPCKSEVTVPPAPQVSVTKTASTDKLSPGGTIVYTVTVTNTGTLPADNTQVSDPLAAGLTAYSTTCAATGGALCPNGAGPSTGPLNETIATLPVSGSVVYTITAAVSSNLTNAVTNTVRVTPPPNGLCTPGNTAPPCTATVTSAPPPSTAAVPLDARWMLLLLAALLAMHAVRRMLQQR
ncbi:hypothetical protein GCM10027082_05610 [Comamonas humi]